MDQLEAEINIIATKIAEMLIPHVQQATVNKQWKCAHRSDRGNFGKLRIEMSDGPVEKIHPPTDEKFVDLLDELRGIRDKISNGASKCYATKITVYPDGSHQLELNFDAKDPSFFDY